MVLPEAVLAILDEVLSTGFFAGRAAVCLTGRAAFFAAFAALLTGFFAFTLVRARSFPGFFMGRFAGFSLWRTADLTRFALGLARDLWAGFLAMMILE
ncbi:MAG: hypothetical protein H0T80_06935 [Betaproteobacteria bacterium]|nr:hypothetical protein [Betaproteobacteria bacterium]